MYTVFSDDTVVWSAVGGADIYRGQAVVHGHDEFFPDFAKQVRIVHYSSARWQRKPVRSSSKRVE